MATPLVRSTISGIVDIDKRDNYTLTTGNRTASLKAIYEANMHSIYIILPLWCGRTVFRS